MFKIQLPEMTVIPDSIPSPSKELSSLKALSADELINKLVSTMVDFAIHLAIAIFVFYVGKFIIGKLYSFVAGIMVRRKVDRSLSTFVLSLVRMLLYFILIVTVIGILGINTSSFIAIFASAGVAIGMALSGTLQNFAGGVLILLLKPYKIGDYIEAQGFAGTVTEIQIFSTIICTPDNKSIIIPNGGLSTGSINNWSREEFRRVQWDVSISYGDDVAVARRIITDMLLADSRVIKDSANADRIADEIKAEHHTEEIAEEQSTNWFGRLLQRRHRKIKQRMEQAEERQQQQLLTLRPAVDRRPTVVLGQMADSSINLTVRAWVRSSDYWGVYYDINELIYTTLPQHGLSFPFPQMDVHIVPADTPAQ